MEYTLLKLKNEKWEERKKNRKWNEMTDGNKKINEWEWPGH